MCRPSGPSSLARDRLQTVAVGPERLCSVGVENQGGNGERALGGFIVSLMRGLRLQY
jgi:hypothetical protein